MSNFKSTILLVDDSEDQIDLLTDLLDNKYEIISALDGNIAMEIAKSQPQPDLILLDVMMPQPDGYEVCRRLKADLKTNHIPVILTTALSGVKNESEGLHSGAVDYIHKPYNFELIHARVESHLMLKHQKDILEERIRDRTKELKITEALLIDSLGILAEFRDPETGSHIKRTQSYVNALAKALQSDPDFKEKLDDKDIHLLHQSAPLHDIGKVGVPDNILCKKGMLTDLEFKKMQEHPRQGYLMLNRTMEKLPNKSFFRYALEIAYSHHEKWDGTGYPLGLKGIKIPLSGRLMALADVYDALVNKRCYKEALPHSEARKIIIEQSGSHFDPQIVRAFSTIENIFENISSAYSDSEYERVAISETSDRKIKTILLVDDNEINLEIMRNQLKSLGYMTEIASNGAEALTIIKSSNIDAVLTDLDMPIMNGYELSQNIKQSYPLIPVVAVTASDYQLNKENMGGFGFSGFLLKPFEDDRFKNLLEYLNLC